ncbi:hypothetical protein ACFE04_004817 [Oxalis oulophora]
MSDSYSAVDASEVEALSELCRRLSSSLDDDEFISQEEFRVGLFRNRKYHSLFTDRIFELFDFKHDGKIDLFEFIQTLCVFHPNAPKEEKAVFAFKLYDIWQTGFIEHEEVKEMILALLNESNLILPDEIIEAIIDKTFEDVDFKRDGKIDMEEWKEFVAQYPALLKNMTIPYLADINRAFPSFVLRQDNADELELSQFPSR